MTKQDQIATTEHRIVGTRPVRPDGADKVTGKAVYGADFYLPGMLRGAILRSPHAHARIVSIDTRKAEALAGVKAVATNADFPRVEMDEIDAGEAGINVDRAAQMCLARDKVFYEGQPVVAVAATSPEIATAALDLIEVRYEVLPHVIEIADAMRSDAPVLHDDLDAKGPSNIAARLDSSTGDAEAALATADVVATGRYTTQAVHQGYIEPQACVASVSGDGQAQLWCSSQGAFMVRSVVAAITGMNLADLRVTPLEIGGGFGGKTTVYLEPVATILSKKSGRPVKIVLSRDEVFRSTGPGPGAEIDIRLGATKDGILTAAIVDMRYQVGAFPGAGAGAGVMHALGGYRIEHKRVTGCDVVSNMPSTHAYRAPSAPQAEFAVECAIDDIARQLGMDPIALREKNAVRAGDTSFSGTPHGQIAFMETLAAAKGHDHYSAPLGPNQGRGIAAGWWVNHGGESTAMISIAEDGTAVVATGNPDIGGSRASMAMMAAEVLQIPMAKVRPIVADTASIGFSMLTGGSRTTFATGKAVSEAAAEVVEILKARAAMIWGVDASRVEWRDGEAHCLADGRDEAPLGIKEIASKASKTGGPISVEKSVYPHDAMPTYAVHICDVELDPETGHVGVTRYTAIQDVGRAVHPSYVEGQAQGGAVQGIGWALNEAYTFNKEGRVDNAGFLDYRMPVASDLPMIDTLLVEIPHPTHPFGVKGVGEVPIVPPLAAVANAVSAAAGMRMFDLPMAPARIHAALNAAG
jgi:CO/xanthine dehydrogenase Mo-binding subunit